MTSEKCKIPADGPEPERTSRCDGLPDIEKRCGTRIKRATF
jgi:hypothetical protein